MATIINDPRKMRIYHDRPEFRDSVEPYDEATDQMMADSVPDIESDSGFNSPEVEEAVSQALNSKLVKQPTLGIIDWNTSNKSFISLSKDLHTLGIKNNTFFLKFVMLVLVKFITPNLLYVHYSVQFIKCQERRKNAGKFRVTQRNEKACARKHCVCRFPAVGPAGQRTF